MQVHPPTAQCRHPQFQSRTGCISCALDNLPTKQRPHRMKKHTVHLGKEQTPGGIEWQQQQQSEEEGKVSPNTQRDTLHLTITSVLLHTIWLKFGSTRLAVVLSVTYLCQFMVTCKLKNCTRSPLSCSSLHPKKIIKTY